MWGLLEPLAKYMLIGNTSFWFGLTFREKRVSKAIPCWKAASRRAYTMAQTTERCASSCKATPWSCSTSSRVAITTTCSLFWTSSNLIRPTRSSWTLACGTFIATARWRTRSSYRTSQNSLKRLILLCRMKIASSYGMRRFPCGKRSRQASCRPAWSRPCRPRTFARRTCLCATNWSIAMASVSYSSISIRCSTAILIVASRTACTGTTLRTGRSHASCSQKFPLAGISRCPPRHPSHLACSHFLPPRWTCSTVVPVQLAGPRRRLAVRTPQPAGATGHQRFRTEACIQAPKRIILWIPLSPLSAGSANTWKRLRLAKVINIPGSLCDCDNNMYIILRERLFMSEIVFEKSSVIVYFVCNKERSIILGEIRFVVWWFVMISLINASLMKQFFRIDYSNNLYIDYSQNRWFW